MFVSYFKFKKKKFSNIISLVIHLHSLFIVCWSSWDLSWRPITLSVLCHLFVPLCENGYFPQTTEQYNKLTERHLLFLFLFFLRPCFQSTKVIVNSDFVLHQACKDSILAWSQKAAYFQRPVGLLMAGGVVSVCSGARQDCSIWTLFIHW